MGTARFYIQNVSLFALLALGFFPTFPRFMMQNVDGVNTYFIIDKLSVWRASPFETATFTPLQSMTSTLGYPINPIFTPPFWTFIAFSDPTVRLYLLTVVAGCSVLISSLFFYTAIGIRRVFAVAAAWIAVALVMLQDTNLLQILSNVQAMVWAYVGLAILALTGRQTGRSGVVCPALFQLAFLAYVFCDPVWHLTILPMFGIVAAALILGADSASERRVKVASLASAFVIQIGLRTYESLYFTLANTARSVLPQEYAAIARAPSSAGILFRADASELAFGVLLIVGLGVARLSDVSTRPRLADSISRAAVAFFLGTTCAGLLYIYVPQSPAFRPGYFVMMGLPFAALFVVGTLRQLYCLVRSGPHDTILQMILRNRRLAIILTICLGGYALWHVSDNPATTLRFGEIALATAAVGMLVRVGGLTIAGALGATLMIGALQMHIDTSFGERGADTQFDASKRMALSTTPVVQFLNAETAVRPGALFQGYVEDVYERLPGLGSVGDELTGHWQDNQNQFGNGQTLFSWGVFDIPTISEYDPFINPLYYAFFTRLLNEQVDQQLQNYLGATRLNDKVLALMGVHFIVTDRGDYFTALSEVMEWNGFRVVETASPNLASYSPTQVVMASTADDVLRRIESDAFDPQKQVIITDALALPNFLSAPPAELMFDQGGYRVMASSPAWSLIVLPIQYTHCSTISASSGSDARLIRVNLVQTGLVFHGNEHVEVRYRRWPLASPECQHQDYLDTIALHVSDALPLRTQDGN